MFPTLVIGRRFSECRLYDIGKGLALGADGYVTKPYTKSLLAEVVRKILKQEPAAP